MSVVCPQGHTSETTDFCDVCGDPIPAGAPSSPSAAPPPPTTAAPPPAASAPEQQACPNCGGKNPVDALFCEECGYDFTTGQLPAPAPLTPPSSLSLPTTPSAALAVAAAPTIAAGTEWVAEVWVDPDWFSAQQAAGACPPGGSPRVAALPGTTAMIGRKSTSRGISPEIDCGSDGATSHRHAQLSLADDRWSVEDLGSVNGTFVGRPDGIYPTDPLPANQPRALADDERVYVGAWTRVVVRRATPDEKAGTS